MRSVNGWKSVFYYITKHGAELKLSAIGQFVLRPFSRLLSTYKTIKTYLFIFIYFSLIESEVSEKMTRQVATEEPNKGL